MIRRPPRSTLFPYTDALPISSFSMTSRRLEGATSMPGTVHTSSRGVAAQSCSVDVPEIAARPHWRCANAHRDRKSTRLNSSHANISYAVFCLKKKKLECEHE